MKRRTKDRILMGLLAVSLFLNIVFINRAVPALEGLVVAGWALLAAGLLLFLLSFFTLRRRGTGNLIDGGVYGIVRHPMYLGAMVMFLSHIFFGQNWVVTISTVVALVCCYLLIRSADERNLEKFGDEYRRYRRDVPRMNLLMGIIQLVRRGSRKE